MSNVLKMDREDLVAALKARRSDLRKFDRWAMSDHRKREREFERGIKAKARAMLNLSYTEMVEQREADYHFFDLDHGLKQPSCPLSLEQELNDTLRDLALTKQVEFTIDSNSNRWAGLYKLLTFDPDAPASMC